MYSFMSIEVIQQSFAINAYVAATMHGISVFEPSKLVPENAYAIAQYHFESEVIPKFIEFAHEQMKVNNPDIDYYSVRNLLVKKSFDTLVSYLERNMRPIKFDYTRIENGQSTTQHLRYYLLEFETIGTTTYNSYTTLAGFVVYSDPKLGYPEYHRFYASNRFHVLSDLLTFEESNDMIIIPLQTILSQEENNLHLSYQEYYMKLKDEQENIKATLPCNVKFDAPKKAGQSFSKDNQTLVFTPPPTGPLTENEILKIKYAKQSITSAFEADPNVPFESIKRYYNLIEGIAYSRKTKVDKKYIRAWSYTEIVAYIDKQQAPVQQAPVQQAPVQQAPVQQEDLDQLIESYYQHKSMNGLIQLSKKLKSYGVAIKDVSNCANANELKALLATKKAQ